MVAGTCAPRRFRHYFVRKPAATSLVHPDANMPIQALENRYIASDNLIKLLRKLFGGDWEIEVCDLAHDSRFCRILGKS